MNVKGINVVVKNQPVLDHKFIPMSAFTTAFEESAKNGKPVVLALEREDGQSPGLKQKSTARRKCARQTSSMWSAL